MVDWSDEGIENVLLWEMPHRWNDVVRELLSFFPDPEYDSIATAEARGFIVGGAISALLKKPLICIRKYKPLYDSLPGHKVEYTNWKDEPETMYLFHREHHRGRRCLFVDDVFQHGNCLEACLKLLQRDGVSVVSAFHLCDAAEPGARERLTSP